MTEPEPVTRIRWQCPFCRRSWASKYRARDHIAYCHRNPDTRSCCTCAHNAPKPGAFYSECLIGLNDTTYDGERMQWLQQCPMWKARTPAAE